MSTDVEAVRDSLRGVAAGLLTPFDDDLEIDHSKLRDNARAVHEEGIRTFLAAANISEYHSLSQQERGDVVATSVDALPDAACVLAGVGGSTRDAIDLLERYDDVGVDGMMIMPPDHAFLHERGLLEYYRSLGDATDTPLVPYIRGFTPSVTFLGDLSRIDEVAGIKFALEDPSMLASAIEAGDEAVVWIDGLAEPYAVPFWAAGAEGFTAGVSNFRPDIGLALFDALEDGAWERARKLATLCTPYQRFRARPGEDNELVGGISVPAVKKGLELAGLHGGRVREPLVELTPEEEREAAYLYAELDDGIDTLL